MGRPASTGCVGHCAPARPLGPRLFLWPALCPSELTETSPLQRAPSEVALWALSATSLVVTPANCFPYHLPFCLVGGCTTQWPSRYSEEPRVPLSPHSGEPTPLPRQRGDSSPTCLPICSSRRGLLTVPASRPAAVSRHFTYFFLSPERSPSGREGSVAAPALTL